MSDPTTTTPAPTTTAPFKFSISGAVDGVESDALKVINKIHGWILDGEADVTKSYAAVQTLESYVKSVYTLFTVHKAETNAVAPYGILSTSQQTAAAAVAASAQVAQADLAQGAGIGSTLLKVSGLDELGLLALKAGGKLAGFFTAAKTDSLEVKQRMVSDLGTAIADAKAEYEKLKGEVENELGTTKEAAAASPAPALAIPPPAPPAEAPVPPVNG